MRFVFRGQSTMSMGELGKRLNWAWWTHIFLGRMNLQLLDATVSLFDGAQRTFPYFFVRGRNIRYVHIPPDVNIMETLEKRVRGAQRVVPAGQERNELQILITRRKREQFLRQKAKMRQSTG
ncbi:U7 snRNA-associated Sm protein LSm10-like [Tropilaelaps mercedesae]|uniref:U7 snRNA-associated Sm protein LSm10-like n=1 Tax=Tropilaelaps mercedesae TaxID=418985 RepID=A0A1V9XKU6_9ACAR|nr:U7 snRNA-associated Sm protein LSm10-like [Tropilaelaps mercedesae]